MCPSIPFQSLPPTLPVFPLEGVLLLPSGELPLHIFEPRYIAMVNDALRSDRLIGITQYHNNRIIGIGCAGRISSFTETEDNRYYITLQGLCRFRLHEEIAGVQAYRRFHVDWSYYEDDLIEHDVSFDNKEAFFPLLKQYFDKNGMTCDWEIVKQTPDKKLITALSMICPFSCEEKQALLEASTPCDRARTLFTLLEMEAALDCNVKNPSQNPHSKKH